MRPRRSCSPTIAATGSWSRSATTGSAAPRCVGRRAGVPVGPCGGARRRVRAGVAAGRRDDGPDRAPGRLRFSFRDQVRYGDLDTNGHLNNVAYHQFFESARVAYMRGLFPEIEPLGRSGVFGMIFAETHVRFASPGFYEERPAGRRVAGEVSARACKLAFEMRCEADERLLAEGWGTLVGYDYGANRAAPLPDEVAARTAGGTEMEIERKFVLEAVPGRARAGQRDRAGVPRDRSGGRRGARAAQGRQDADDRQDRDRARARRGGVRARRRSASSGCGR